MDRNIEKYVSAFDRSEVSKCLVCLDPPCTNACPQHADVGNILKSLYFRNYIGAVNKLTCDCTYCNKSGKEIESNGHFDPADRVG